MLHRRRQANECFEEQIILSLASRTAAINAANFPLGLARGVQWTLYVKTAGTSTLTFRVNSFTIMENLAQQISTNVVVTSAGIYVFSHHPDSRPQPPGEAGVTYNTNVVLQAMGLGSPGTVRASIAKGDASAWVFGVSARRVR